jgi:hypothetical protein
VHQIFPVARILQDLLRTDIKTTRRFKIAWPGAAGLLIEALGLATALDLTNAVLVIRGPFRVRAHDI